MAFQENLISQGQVPSSRNGAKLHSVSGSARFGTSGVVRVKIRVEILRDLGQAQIPSQYFCFFKGTPGLWAERRCNNASSFSTVM